MSRIATAPFASIATALALGTGVLTAQARWTELGPMPITAPYTGRIAAIAPSVQNANRYYVGGADGGVWRTDNAGVDWTPVGDQLPVTAVGALAVDPTDDRVLFVGTGEGNFANHSRYGLGLARSLDAGATFQMLAASTFAGRCFSRLRVDP